MSLSPTDSAKMPPAKYAPLLRGASQIQSTLKIIIEKTFLDNVASVDPSRIYASGLFFRVIDQYGAILCLARDRSVRRHSLFGTRWVWCPCIAIRTFYA